MKEKKDLPEELLDKLYEKFTEKIQNVYDIFKNFYTEELVDLQNVASKKRIEECVAILSPRSYNEDSTITSYLRKPYLSEEDRQKILDYIENHLDAIASFLQNRFYEEPTKPTILIFFPKVTVTNENDHSIEITELWVKVPIDYKGRCSHIFTMNRSEYTDEQFSSDYMHSHIAGIPRYDLSKFLEPCLGRGPIRNTITTLVTDYNEDLWKLFCFELSKFVETESLTGIPYRYLERVNYGGYKRVYSTLSHISRLDVPTAYKVLLRSFIIHVLSSNKLNFVYSNHNYSFGISVAELILTLSNLFIEWCNSTVGKKVLKVVSISGSQIVHDQVVLTIGWIENNDLYYASSDYNPQSLESYRHKKICDFKGKPVYLKITSASRTEDNAATLLRPDVAAYIAQLILKIVNFYYESNINRNKALL